MLMDIKHGPGHKEEGDIDPKKKQQEEDMRYAKDIIKKIRQDFELYYRSKIRVPAKKAKIIIDEISREFQHWGDKLKIDLSNAIHKYTIHADGRIFDKSIPSDHDFKSEVFNSLTENPKIKLYKTEGEIAIAYDNLDEIQGLALEEVLDLCHSGDQVCEYCDTIAITILDKTMNITYSDKYDDTIDKQMMLLEMQTRAKRTEAELLKK